MKDHWPWDVPDLIGEEEKSELIALSAQGDVEARARLAMSNLRMVLLIASLKAKSEEEKKDLVGDGLLGAWLAAIRYDPSHGSKFCTYATWWIRSFIVQGKKVSHRLLSFAPNLFKLNRELARIYAITGKRIHDESVAEDVASRMGMSPKRVRKLWGSSVCKTYLDAPINDRFLLSDVVASDAFGPEEELSQKEHAAAVKSMAKSVLSVLSDREAFVVKRVLMEGETFSSVGEKLGVSKQRVKQICDKAAVKMRKRAAVDRSSFHICFEAG